MVNVVASVLVELAVLSGIGFLVVRRWRKVPHTARELKVSLFMAGGAVLVSGCFMADLPPLMLPIVMAGGLMVLMAAMVQVRSDILETFDSHREARRALAEGYPPRPQPLGGVAAGVIGFGVAFVSLLAGIFVEAYVNAITARMAIATGNEASWHEQDPKVILTLGFVSVGLGAVVAIGIYARKWRKIRHWEDLTAGIERRVHAAEQSSSTSEPIGAVR